jgi:hypothetical protein
MSCLYLVADELSFGLTSVHCGQSGALPKETVDIHSAMEKRKGMTK